MGTTRSGGASGSSKRKKAPCRRRGCAAVRAKILADRDYWMRERGAAIATLGQQRAALVHERDAWARERETLARAIARLSRPWWRRAWDWLRRTRSEPSASHGVLYLLPGLLMVAAFHATAIAQQVTAANLGATPFTGWVRATVDQRPPHDAGAVSGCRYVLGRQTGVDAWAIDLEVQLQPGESVTWDLAGSRVHAPPSLDLPADPLGHFGGWCSVGGVPLPIVALRADGAGWHAHLRGRIARMLVADCWLDWRPSQPWLATGEVLVTASDPSVPDVTVTVPADVLLRFGDGWVHAAGAGWGGAVVPAGATFADGQSRAVPVVIAWARHVVSDEGWQQIVAAAGRTVGAVGVARPLPGGRPRLPAGWSGEAWVQGRWLQALAGLHDWRQPVVGPNRNSADTGGQQDQVFVGGECGDVGGREVYYLSALKLAARPCHHRKADGSPYEPGSLDGVMFWMGRPHSATGNLLGKSRHPTIEEANGWNGPDREHWLYNGLAVATRATGSHALQHLLAEQGRLFLRSETLPTGGTAQWFTSRPDAARAVGWACLLADHLWLNLEDRALAALVRDRVQQRIRTVYLPAFGGRDIWDVRRDDPRLGPGEWWMPWQQAVGCYGLDVASERWGIPEGRALALRGARAVLRDAWRLSGGRWQSSAQRPVVGDATNWSESFNLFGLPLAVAVVLRHDPADAQAGAIWRQLLVDADQPGELSWLPPGVTAAPAPPPVPTATSATYGGFVWTFSAARPTGTFCTGEPWVLGPVTITGVTPAPATVNGRQRNGTMLNPSASCANGYDSESFWNYNDGKFQPSLRASFPLTVATGSVVSTLSADAQGSEQVGFLLDAAVLTVLASPPPADAFRPPYVGTDKSIPGTLAGVDWTALASLPAAPGMPALDPLRAKLAHLWLDHCPEWVSRYLHPQRGLSDYYRGFTSEIGTAALAVNTAGLAADVRRELVVRLVQIGIDNYAVMQAGARWGVNGHCNGRKFPILFAGRMLGHAGMLGVGQSLAPGTGKVPFSEDGQTFYVTRDPDGRINGGHGGYTAADLGLPDWGNFHLENRASDDASWPGVTGYRVCCSANGWVGQTLAMRVMGLRAAWNQPAYFDYMDRYLQWTRTNAPAWQRAWEPWHAAMWDAHRGAF